MLPTVILMDTIVVKDRAITLLTLTTTILTIPTTISSHYLSKVRLRRTATHIRSEPQKVHLRNDQSNHSTAV
jgi:hypothetical protein